MTLYHPLCVECDEHGDYALATRQIHTPWGLMHVCEACYERMADAYAGREPDYGAGVGEQCDRALAEKQKGR